MKKVLLILALFSNALIFSQIDSTKIAFVSYWSIGDSYDFKVTKIKQQYKEGKLTKDEKQQYIANFEVIDSTETSYTINWTFENDLENTYNIPTELLDKFSKYKLTEIQYKTSEVGELLEILNWKEVGEAMNNMFDEIIEILGQKDIKKKEDLKTVMAPFKQIYGSKEGVEQLILKELQYFHFPMGLEFDITEPLYYDDELPNIFGGKPIKAKAKLYFENVDFEESFCVVKHELRVDPNDTKGLINEVFKKMNLDENEMKKVFETAIFEINDNNTFEYYYYPGIPHKIETIRESIIDMGNEKGKRIDKTTIELIYYE